MHKQHAAAQQHGKDIRMHKIDMHEEIHDTGKHWYKHSSRTNGGQRQYVINIKQGNTGQMIVNNAIDGQTIQQTNMQ